MAESRTVAFLLAAWEDADRAFAELTPEEASERRDGGSSFGWTFLHLGWGILIDEHLRNLDPHPVLQAQIERHGRSGDSDDWEGVQRAVAEVRTEVTAYLEPLTDDQLDRIEMPPMGPYPAVSLRYLLTRWTAHTYFHVGEVASKRGLGDNFPGPLTELL